MIVLARLALGNDFVSVGISHHVFYVMRMYQLCTLQYSDFVGNIIRTAGAGSRPIGGGRFAFIDGRLSVDVSGFR